MAHELAEGSGIQTGGDDCMPGLRTEIKPGTRNVHQGASDIGRSAGVMTAVPFGGENYLAK
ncbi:hypothetical protein D3C87_1666590 [compost metagenome]